jgi:hypothetical protein
LRQWTLSDIQAGSVASIDPVALPMRGCDG